MRALVLVVLVAGITLRFLYLDADPDYYLWAGYITDEGRWVAHAREMALFGRIINTHWLVHLILAPLFQLSNYAVFKLLGVSIWTTRLITALSGSALLIAFWLLLRRVVGVPAMLVGLALLSFDVNVIMLSRVAVPEMPAMFLQLVVYVTIVAGLPSATRMFAAGLLLHAMVATKATTLFMLAIFSVIALVHPPEEQTRRWRLRRLLILWAGFLAPLLVTIPFWLPFAWRYASALVLNTEMIETFLGVSGPYKFAAFAFESDFAPVFDVWAMVVCFVGVGWLAREKDAVEPTLGRYFVTSMIWNGLFAPLMLTLRYFPDRYKVHVLVPMAVSIATGICIAQNGSPASLGDAVRRMTRGRRALTLGILGAPTAALWAPTLAAVSAFGGVDPMRLRAKLPCFLIALIASVWAAHHRALAGRSLRFFFVFPIVGVLGWSLFERIAMTERSFWPMGDGGPAGWWLLGPWLTMFASAALLRARSLWASRRWPAWIAAAALCYAASTVARIAPSYWHPHYSMKLTSQQLGVSLTGAAHVIAASRTEGLFNGNALRYRTVLGKTWPADKPEVIVVAFSFADPDGILQREYQLIATYRLFLSPEYEDEKSVTLDRIHHEETVKVYRRK